MYRDGGSPSLKSVPVKIDTGAVQLRRSSKGIHLGVLDLGTENLFAFMLSIPKNAIGHSTISVECPYDRGECQSTSATRE